MSVALAVAVAFAAMQALRGSLELVRAGGRATRPDCSTWIGYST